MTGRGVAARWLAVLGLSALVVAACGDDSARSSSAVDAVMRSPEMTRPAPSPASAATPVTTPTSVPTATPGAATTTNPAVTASPAPAAFSGRWVELARLAQDRVEVFRLVALQGGRVLVLGRGGDPNGDWASLILDPAAGAWSGLTPVLEEPLEIGPYDAAAAFDGRLFVAGATESRSWTETGGHWSYVGSDVERRHEQAPAAAVLADGRRILVAGGCHESVATRAVDVFDLGPGWRPDAATATGDLVHARVGAPAVTLSDGRVLVAGSQREASYWDDQTGSHSVCASNPTGLAEWTAEVYDPTTGRFTLAGVLPEPDRAAIAAMGISVPSGRPSVADAGRLFALPDGDALLLDRTEAWPEGPSVTRSLRFDGATDAWTETGMAGVGGNSWYEQVWGVQREGAAAASLAGGGVLVAGGEIYDAAGGRGTRWADLYDPVAGRWLPLPPLPEALGSAAAVSFPDGTAIVVGGTLPDYRREEAPELIAVGFVPWGVVSSVGTPGASEPRTPTASPEAACPDVMSAPTLVAMEPDQRIDCFGGRDLVFDADVVVSAGTIVDRVAFALPAVFRPVKRPSPDWPDPAVTWPVYLVDAGAAQAAPGTALDLRVADPSVIPADLPARMRARVTGHVDDPAATACRPPPAGFIGSDMTEEQAVLMCRAAFVVTRIEPLQ